MREAAYGDYLRVHPADAAFSHVLVDEAGQALAPEALVPLTLLSHSFRGVAGRGGRAMLCGDPRCIRAPVCPSGAGRALRCRGTTRARALTCVCQRVSARAPSY
jgi:hypothetical protein